MKTSFYTFRNKKVLLVEANRFYLVKNKKEYNKVIEDLLEYDAVSSPYFADEAKYPLILELQSGFAPNLKEVTAGYLKKVLNDEFKKNNDLLKKLDKV